MRTTKQTIITLDEGDTIQVRYNEGIVVISADDDRHKTGPTIDLPGGAEEVMHPDLDDMPLPKLATIFV